MKRISIIGGTGYIGTKLTAVLARRGYEVRIFSRSRNVQNSAECLDFVSYVENCNRYDDREMLKRELKGSSAVINLVGTFDSKNSRLERAHLQLPQTLLELSEALGIEKMIQMSALGVTEDAPSKYHKTRYKAEKALLEKGKNSSVDLNIVRSSIVLGSGDNFSYFMARMINYLPIVPLPLANTQLQPIVIDDLVEFIIRLIEAPKSDKMLYEVAGPKSYTMRELVNLMAMEIKGDTRLIKSFPDGLTSLMTRLFGWLPGSPLTRNQFLAAKSPSTTTKNALPDFGIEPTPVEALFAYELYEKVRDRYFDDRLIARREEV